MSKDVVNVQYKGEWYRTNVTFENEDSYRCFINKMCTTNKASINMREPETIFSDISTYPDLNLRITVTHGLLSMQGDFSSHIRIATKKKRDVMRLVNDGFMSMEQAAVLISAVKQLKSIIICGGSGSGKTILLNMLLEHFPTSICGTIIQESDELHSETHQNIQVSHSITAKGEGGLSYSLKSLATTALLKGTSLFMIGEIKGSEADEFVQASRTSSTYCTTHAESCFGAIPRIVELSKTTADYSQAELEATLANNIDYVVYCEHYKLKEIAAVKGYNTEKKEIMYDLYEFEQTRKEGDV